MDNNDFDPYATLIHLQRMDVQISQNMSELSLLVVDMAKTQDQIKRDLANIRRDIAYLYDINTKAQK